VLPTFEYPPRDLISPPGFQHPAIIQLPAIHVAVASTGFGFGRNAHCTPAVSETPECFAVYVLVFFVREGHGYDSAPPRQQLLVGSFSRLNNPRRGWPESLPVTQAWAADALELPLYFSSQFVHSGCPLT